MRLSLVLFLSTISFYSFGQLSNMDFTSYGLPDFPIDEETQLVSYSDVVNVDGVAAADLYQLGLDWINKYYKNYSSVMQVKDNQKFLLEGKHSFYVMKDIKGSQVKGELIKYQFNLMFRDGRYKYVITKINVQKTAYYGIENWLTDETLSTEFDIQSYLEQIHIFFTETYIPSMLEGIVPAEKKVEEQW